MGWYEAYERLREFCSRLGGKLVSLVDVGMAKPGEKLFSVSCVIPSRLSNDVLAKAVSEVKTKLWSDVTEVLHELGSFEIIEESPIGGRYVKFEPVSDVVRVYSSNAKEYGIDPSTIDYVYPDAVEDYVERKEGIIEVKAWGSKTSLKKGKVKAFSDGWVAIREPERSEVVKKVLNELDEMLRDILKNPRNFFKFYE